MIGTIERKKALQMRASILVLTAIVMSAIGFFGSSGGESASIVYLLLQILALIPWIWGLGCYAMSKGYSAVVGLLGLLSVLGLIILVVLPNRWRVSLSPGVDPLSNYPRPPIVG